MVLTKEVNQRLLMFVGGLLAGLSVYFFCPKTNYVTLTQTEVLVKEVKKTATKVRVVDRTVTVTEPGKTTVIVEKEKENSKENESTTEKHEKLVESTPNRSRYSIYGGGGLNTSLLPIYILGVDARLGNLPVLVGAWASYPSATIGLSVRVEM